MSSVSSNPGLVRGMIGGLHDLYPSELRFIQEDGPYGPKRRDERGVGHGDEPYHMKRELDDGILFSHPDPIADHKRVE